jgi:hypothetical protein
MRDRCAHELGLVPQDHHHGREAGLVGHASGARYHGLSAKLEELFVAPHARGKTRREHEPCRRRDDLGNWCFHSRPHPSKLRGLLRNPQDLARDPKTATPQSRQQPIQVVPAGSVPVGDPVVTTILLPITSATAPFRGPGSGGSAAHWSVPGS